MVKPGGTLRPILDISARLAPFPPNIAFILWSPSLLPGPNTKTRFEVGGEATAFPMTKVREDAARCEIAFLDAWAWKVVVEPLTLAWIAALRPALSYRHSALELRTTPRILLKLVG